MSRKITTPDRFLPIHQRFTDYIQVMSRVQTKIKKTVFPPLESYKLKNEKFNNYNKKFLKSRKIEVRVLRSG